MLVLFSGLSEEQSRSVSHAVLLMWRRGKALLNIVAIAPWRCPAHTSHVASGTSSALLLLSCQIQRPSSLVAVRAMADGGQELRALLESVAELQFPKGPDYHVRSICV